MNGRRVILILEDSSTCAAATVHAATSATACSTETKTRWFEAAEWLVDHAPSFVVIDWTLDRVSPADMRSSVFSYLRKQRIPHVIFTATPEAVPASVGCEVIDKRDPARLEAAIKKAIG